MVLIDDTLEHMEMGIDRLLSSRSAILRTLVPLQYACRLTTSICNEDEMYRMFAKLARNLEL